MNSYGYGIIIIGINSNNSLERVIQIEGINNIRYLFCLSDNALVLLEYKDMDILTHVYNY